jgi:hypothetical protein
MLIEWLLLWPDFLYPDTDNFCLGAHFYFPYFKILAGEET